MSWKDSFPKENVYFETKNGILYNGDVLSVLRTFPDESVDCVVTSPPYWGLRDYGEETVTDFGDWYGQLGLEPDFNLYLKHLWDVFEEVRRVLKPTGTLWVNLGDSYGGSGMGTTKNVNVEEYRRKAKENYVLPNGKSVSAKLRGTKYQKSLLLIPERFAIGMVERGWILRNKIIWCKTNGLPESVKDRFTKSYEYVYFFTKSRKYYFNQLLEPVRESSVKRLQRAHKYVRVFPFDLERRNMRDVWIFSTAQFSGRKFGVKTEHFAVFPEELPRRCIEAGCPVYVCKRCGSPREKIYERIAKIGKTKEVNGKYRNSDGLSHSAGARGKYYTRVRRFKLPKSMRIAFAKWLRKFVKGKEEALDGEFGRSKWLHWIRTDDSGQSLPSPDEYVKLKRILNLDDTWDKWIMEMVTTLVDDAGNSYREYSYSECCSCGCDEWESGIVLDIFAGTGTTLVVAEKLKRKWIGIELNPRYCELTRRRVEKTLLPLFELTLKAPSTS
jgi:DNA modification methylase